MLFKRLLFSFCFFAYACLAQAQSLSTNLVVTGTTDALTFNVVVTPTFEFKYNDSKLWMAIIQGQQVYFYNDTTGFVPYAGGLKLLLSGQPAEAPAVRTITKSFEIVYLPAWNTRSILGSEIYVGYGSSFAELVKNARYKKLYTMVEKYPDGVEELFGRVTLVSKSKNTSNTSTTSADFSRFDVRVNGTANVVTSKVVGNPSYDLGCTVLPSTNTYTHLCVTRSVLGLDKIFVFTLSGGTITSGIYAFCSFQSTTEACSTKLATNPDGTVTGTVVGKVTSASIEQSNSQIDAVNAVDTGVSKQSEVLNTELITNIEALIKQARGASY